MLFKINTQTFSLDSVIDCIEFNDLPKNVYMYIF